MKQKTVIRPTSGGIFPSLTSGGYHLCLGNGNEWEVFLYKVDKNSPLDGIFIGIPGRAGCHWFYTQPTWQTVRVVLGIETDYDACNLADFISCQFSQQTLLIQGSYEITSCSDYKPLVREETAT